MCTHSTVIQSACLVLCGLLFLRGRDPQFVAVFFLLLLSPPAAGSDLSLELGPCCRISTSLVGWWLLSMLSSGGSRRQWGSAVPPASPQNQHSRGGCSTSCTSRTLLTNEHHVLGESCWATLLLVFRIWPIPDLPEGEYGRLRVGSSCFPEHSASFWLLLALPALLRHIPGLRGAGCTGVGELSSRSEPHPLPTSLLPGAQRGDVPKCWGQWLG